MDVSTLAEQFHYKVEKVPNAEAVTISQGDYAIQLEAGFGHAMIYWHGAVEKSVQLEEQPRHTGDSWYLNLNDVRALFGLTQVFAGHEYSLFEKNYNVVLGSFPTSVKNGRLELQAFVYDWTSREDFISGQMPLQMSLEENGDHGGDELVSRNIAIVNNPDASDVPVRLFNLTASRTLTTGSHQVSVVIRIGERILWKQTVGIVAE